MFSGEMWGFLLLFALVRKLRIETIADMEILGSFLTRLRPIRCSYGYTCTGAAFGRDFWGNSKAFYRMLRPYAPLRLQ
jgi:hypothetical protein